jgi:hypothetical protein
MKLTNTVLMCALTLGLNTAYAQTAPAAPADKPADTMQVLRDKLKADKKLLVAANMGLTESEAKGFWPVYEAYQKDLEKLNKRLGDVVKSYAADYKAGSLTDDKAKKLIREVIAIDEDEAKLKKSYVPKLSKVLPGTKVARYIQIENKIRAVIKYEMANEVPLAP